MAAQCIDRLEPRITKALIALRNGENNLRNLEIRRNQTREEIESLQLWLNNNPLDHPDRVEIQNALASLQQSFTQVCNDQEMIRKNVNVLRYNLQNWVVNSSDLWQDFPFSFRCETVEDIDAIHTLRNSIVAWPDGCVFRVALRLGNRYRPHPPVPFEDLSRHARTLNLEVLTMDF